MQTIVFFALHNTIDFYHIGGLDSLARRLAISLSDAGDSVEFVFYGAPVNKTVQITPRVSQRHFMSLDEAFESLGSNVDHVISLYLKPADRISYARFRKSRQGSIRFHHIYSVWHELRVKRELLFAEARLYPFNGSLFCLSPRLFNYVSKWSNHGVLIWPPVPDSFFCISSEKADNEKIKVTFAGRVDPGKGINEAIAVFKLLEQLGDFDTRICGYAWSHRPATMEMHERLLADPHISYEPVDYKSWSPEVDSNLLKVLRETDILLLPYKKLSSTIDTPLLLLEGMANLCAVITPDLGDLHETCGDSRFNLSGRWDENAVVSLIKNARGFLGQERMRLADRNTALGYNATTVVARFRQLINA